MMSNRLYKFFTNRDLFIQVTIGIVLTWHFVNSFFATGYLTASILTYGIIILDILFLWVNKDKFLIKLFLVSLITGWVELFADQWLVQDIQKLVYDPHGPFVLASPLYMPFAWTAILFQFSYMTWKSFQKVSFGLVVLQSAIFGGILVPLYEHFAYGAGWWKYQDVAMFGKAPYFIILGEIFILLLMPFIIKQLEKSSIFTSLLFGFAEGLWIYFAYRFAFEITG